MGKKRYNEDEGLPSFSDMEDPAEVGGGSDPAAADGLPSFSDMGEPEKLTDIVEESPEVKPVPDQVDFNPEPIKKSDGGINLPTPQLDPYKPDPKMVQVRLDGETSRTYEDAQKRYAEIDAALAMKPNHGKAPMADHYKAEQKRLKAELELASKASAKAVEELEPVAQRVLEGLDLTQFTMKDVNGLTVADPKKVDEFAAQAAEQKGLPDDGFFKQYLHNKMVGEVEGDIIRPRVEKEFKKQYYLKYGETPKGDAEKEAKAMGMAKKVQDANLSLKAVGDDLTAQAEQEYMDLQTQRYGRPPEEVAAAIQEGLDYSLSQHQLGYGNMIVDGRFMGTDAQLTQYNNEREEIYREANQDLDKLRTQAMQDLNAVSNKYNARYRRHAEEVERGLKSEVDKMYEGVDENVTKRVQEVYKDALTSVLKQDERYRDMISEVLPWQFTWVKSYLSSLGGSVKGMSAATGFEAGRVWGEYLEKEWNPGQVELEKFEDLLDPIKLTKSTGQLAGSMTGSIVAAGGTAIATEGVGAPYAISLLASGFAGWAAETLDITGRMYDETFAETGNVETALKRSKQSMDSQIALMPFYSLEGLPFLGKALKAIPLPERILLGGAIEFGTEFTQEYPQNLFEEAIRQDKPYMEGLKNINYETASRTALNIAPVAILGGAGAIKTEVSETLKEEKIKKQAAALAAKFVMGKQTRDGMDQFVAGITNRHGEKFSLAFIGSLHASGRIDEAEATTLVNSIKLTSEFSEKAQELGMDAQRSQVFTSLKFKHERALQAVESETDPMLKSVAQKRADEISKQLETLVNGGDSKYAIMEFPNGESYVLSHGEAETLINDDKFVSNFLKGDVKLTISGDEQLAQKLEQKSTVLKPDGGKEGAKKEEAKGPESTGLEVPASEKGGQGKAPIQNSPEEKSEPADNGADQGKTEKGGEQRSSIEEFEPKFKKEKELIADGKSPMRLGEEIEVIDNDWLSNIKRSEITDVGLLKERREEVISEAKEMKLSGPEGMADGAEEAIDILDKLISQAESKQKSGKPKLLAKQLQLKPKEQLEAELAELKERKKRGSKDEGLDAQIADYEAAIAGQAPTIETEAEGSMKKPNKTPAPESEGYKKPTTVRELADLDASEQSGLLSGAFLSAVEKGQTFTVGGKKYTVTRKTKGSRSDYEYKGKKGSYTKTAVTITDDKGQKVSYEIWDDWVQDGSNMVPTIREGKGSANFSRDIEGDLTVDLLNEKNPLHSPSDSFSIIQKALSKVPEKQAEIFNQKKPKRTFEGQPPSYSKPYVPKAALNAASNIRSFEPGQDIFNVYNQQWYRVESIDLNKGRAKLNQIDDQGKIIDMEDSRFREVGDSDPHWITRDQYDETIRNPKTLDEILGDDAKFLSDEVKNDIANAKPRILGMDFLARPYDIWDNLVSNAAEIARAQGRLNRNEATADAKQLEMLGKGLFKKLELVRDLQVRQIEKESELWEEFNKIDEGVNKYVGEQNQKRAEEWAKPRVAKSKEDLYKINANMFGIEHKQALASALLMDRMIQAMAQRAGIDVSEMYSRITFEKTTPDQLPTDVLMQSDHPIRHFYSNAQIGLILTDQESATADQWMKMIIDKGGRGTSQELDWIGLRSELEFFQSVSGLKSIPKDVVQYYLEKNQVEVVEISSDMRESDQAKIFQKQVEVQDAFNVSIDLEANDMTGTGYIDSVWVVTSGGGRMDVWDNSNRSIDSESLPDDFNVAGLEDALSELADMVEETVVEVGTGGTRYENWTLEGGENYREVLLTMPMVGDLTEAQRDRYNDLAKAHAYESSLTDEELKEFKELDRQDREFKSSGYYSNHYDEANILVHYRAKDRISSNGEKVLFVEEIQSDWAQEGKKHGFMNQRGPTYERKQQIEKEMSELLEESYGKGLIKNGSTGQVEAFFKNNPDLGERRARLIEERNRLSKKPLSMPDTPYAKTDQWAGLAVRRIMSYAASNGYDRVAWTTGEQQTKRYSLEQHVDKIIYSKSDGKYLIGAVLSDGGTRNFTDLDEQGVRNMVGDEVAQRIFNGEGTVRTQGTAEVRTLEDDGLKIGGSGMKAYYDKIIPKVFQKEAQRFDKAIKVEVADLTEKRPFRLIVKPTSEFRIRGSRNLGSYDGSLDPNEEIKRVAAKHGISEDEIMVDGGTGKFVGLQLSVPITDEARMNLRGAVPLFQADRAAILRSEAGFNIYALTNPNVSSPLHEMAHGFEPFLTTDEKSTVLKWAGTESWTTETSEKFARGFEKYLAEGKAPIRELQAIFDKFKDWMAGIYHGIVGSDIDIELNDAMREIYAKMLFAEPNTGHKMPVQIGSQGYQNGAGHLVGRSQSRTIPTGEKVSGKFKVVPADHVLASHNENTFQKTVGFPTTKDGTTVNDRDYGKDKSAQQQVRMIAQNLDDRALAQMPFVTEHGIVVSGNNRTMSRKVAAQMKTDGKYLDALRDVAEMYGIDPELIGSIKNPMLVFELDVTPPYNTKTFAAFNKTEMKEKAPLDKAIEISKTISDKARENLFGVFEDEQNMSDVTGNPTKVKQIVSILLDDGIMQSNEIPRYFVIESKRVETTREGVAFIEGLLLGAALDERIVRAMDTDQMGDIRNKLKSALIPITANKTLGEERSIQTELYNAVDAIREAKKSGLPLVDWLAQRDLFADRSYTLEDVAVGLLLEKGGFKQWMQRFNTAVTEQDLFLGKTPTKSERLNEEFNEIAGNYAENIRKYLEISGAPRPSDVSGLAEETVEGSGVVSISRPQTAEEFIREAPEEFGKEVSNTLVDIDNGSLQRVRYENGYEMRSLKMKDGSEYTQFYGPDGNVITKAPILTVPPGSQIFKEVMGVEDVFAVDDAAFDAYFKQKLGDVNKASISEAAQKLADAIRKGKIGGKGDAAMSFIIPPPLWDAAIEVVATAIQAGGKMADAILEGIKYLRETDWYKELSPKAQRTAEHRFNEHFRTDEDVEGSILELSTTHRRNEERLLGMLKDPWKRFMVILFDSQHNFMSALKKFDPNLAQIVKAYVTVVPNSSARADKIIDDLVRPAFSGISKIQNIEFKGQNLSERELYNAYLISNRVLEVSRKLQDKFERYMQVRQEIQDLLSRGEQDLDLVREANALKSYLKINDVLGEDEDGNPVLLQRTFTQGLTSVTAAQNLKMMEERMPELFNKLAAHAHQYHAAYEYLLGEQLKAELVNQEQYDDLVAYKYVPMRNIAYILEGMMDNEQAYKSFKDGALIKRLEQGSEEDLSVSFEDAQMAHAKATYKKIALATAAKKLAEAVGTNPDNGIFSVRKIIGISPSGNIEFEKLRPGQDVIKYYVRGQERHITAEASIVQEFYYQNRHMFTGNIKTFMDVISLPNRIATAVLTNENPAFGIYQMVMDVPHAILADDAYGSFTTGIPKITYQLLRNAVFNRRNYKKLFEEARKHGALISFARIEADPLDPASTGFGTGFFSKLLSYTPLLSKDKQQGFLRGVQKFNSAFEYATRIAVYEQKRDKLLKQYKKEYGESASGQALEDIRTLAAASAANILNYARGGVATKLANPYLLYLNTSFQVFHSVADEAQKHPLRTSLKISELAAYGSLFLMMSMMLMSGDDDEEKEAVDEYDRMTDQEKNNYAHLYLGKSFMGMELKGEDKWLRLKKPELARPLMNQVEYMVMNRKYGITGRPSIIDDVVNNQPLHVKKILSSNPWMNAHMTYNQNFSMYRSNEVVRGEEQIYNVLEGLDDDRVNQIYKYMAVKSAGAGMYELYSPKRLEEATRALVGDYRRNPFTNVPLETLNEVLTLVSKDYSDVRKITGPRNNEKGLFAKSLDLFGFRGRFHPNIPDVDPDVYTQIDEHKKRTKFPESEFAINERIDAYLMAKQAKADVSASQHKRTVSKQYLFSQVDKMMDKHSEDKQVSADEAAEMWKFINDVEDPKQQEEVREYFTDQLAKEGKRPIVIEIKNERINAKKAKMYMQMMARLNQTEREAFDAELIEAGVEFRDENDEPTGFLEAIWDLDEKNNGSNN